MKLLQFRNEQQVQRHPDSFINISKLRFKMKNNWAIRHLHFIFETSINLKIGFCLNIKYKISTK